MVLRVNISQTGWFDHEKNSSFKWFFITVFAMTDYLKGEFYHQVKRGSLCNLQNKKCKMSFESASVSTSITLQFEFLLLPAQISPEDRTENATFKDSWSPVVHTGRTRLSFLWRLQQRREAERSLSATRLITSQTERHQGEMRRRYRGRGKSLTGNQAGCKNKDLNSSPSCCWCPWAEDNQRTTRTDLHFKNMALVSSTVMEKLIRPPCFLQFLRHFNAWFH